MRRKAHTPIEAVHEGNWKTEKCDQGEPCAQVVAMLGPSSYNSRAPPWVCRQAPRNWRGVREAKAERRTECALETGKACRSDRSGELIEAALAGAKAVSERVQERPECCDAQDQPETGRHAS